MSLQTDQQRLDLAVAYQRAGRIAEAETLYRQLATAYPGHAALQHEIGVLAFQSGRLAEARPFFAQAVVLAPNNPDYRNNLGLVLQELGDFEAAASSYTAAIQLQPGLGIVYYNLGIARMRQQQWDAAVAGFQRSLSLEPNHIESHLNLALSLSGKRDLPAAVEVLQAAVARFPNEGRLWNNLGNALAGQREFEAALRAAQRALQCAPNSAAFRNNLGGVLKDLGRFDEAIACYRAGLAIDPALATLRSSLILTLHLDPGSTPAVIAAECRQWQERHARPLRAWQRPFLNGRVPDRPLRIGYVSPDLRDHPVGRHLLTLLGATDRTHFETVCYSDASPMDSLTGEIRAAAHAWCDSTTWTDEQLAEKIHGDGIDILVDLSLHTAWNRLLVFARKPAPVQVSFAGYPGSTGLEAIDYRLTDRFLEPPEPSASAPTEQAVRLADSFWCFDPPRESPAVSALPALSAGHVVFGCLNQFSKVNDRVLALWGRVLRAVPTSRLRMLCPTGASRDRVLRNLAGAGVHPERVEFVHFLPRHAYLAEHHRLDLILDTFPYNGHVTTCDALWMGVPVVSLTGELPVGRGGLSILTNAGLPDLVTDSEDDFVRIAVDLANDLPRLAALRAGLRTRMLSSPLMDSKRFARSVEAAYRTMWHRWCTG